MSDVMGGGRSASAPAGGSRAGGVQARMELRSQIRNLVTTAVKDRTGPSFDERLADAVSKKNAQMKASEKEQWRRINDCRERGHLKSEAFSPLPKGPVKSSESLIAAKTAERERFVNNQTKAYYKERKAMLEKIRNREPLFKLTEVAAAQGALRAAAQKRKDDMKEDEAKRWAHLDEINRSVLAKPLLMD